MSAANTKLISDISNYNVQVNSFETVDLNETIASIRAANDMYITQGLLYHRTCEPDFLCS